jgi:imidazolonepropionase-like amidohydrolase
MTARIATARLAGLVVATLTLASSAPVHAQRAVGEDGTFLIRGATVVTGTGQRMQNASVLIRNGEIAEVGSNVTAPAGATVIDATGKFVYPGMIDSFTPIGLTEVGGIATMNLTSELGDYNPNMRALVAINVESEMLAITRANGVTSALTAPSGGTISGQAALINMAGWTWEDMAVRSNAAYVMTYPRAAGFRFGPAPGAGQERAAEERVARQVAELKDFLRSVKEYEAFRAGGSETVDINLESTRPLIRGEEPALISADPAEQIRGALALADTFGLKIIINGADEAWKVAELLAQKNVPVVLGSIQSSPAADAPYDALYAQPGVLHRAGVKFAFSTGGAANARHVPYHAALAVAYGLPADAAMQALTLWPAQIFGVSDRIGSIEVGKMANVFVTDGDPLDVRTHVLDVFIKGRHVPHDDKHYELYRKYTSRPKNN